MFKTLTKKLFHMGCHVYQSFGIHQFSLVESKNNLPRWEGLPFTKNTGGRLNENFEGIE